MRECRIARAAVAAGLVVVLIGIQAGVQPAWAVPPACLEAEAVEAPATGSVRAPDCARAETDFGALMDHQYISGASISADRSRANAAGYATVPPGHDWPAFGINSARSVISAATPLTISRQQVLYSETFDDPTSRYCLSGITTPGVGIYECFDGMFKIQSLDPSVSLWSRLPPRLANARIAVDAHLTGGSEARYITLGCRDQGSGLAPMRYELTVAPAIQAFNLGVWQDGWKDLTEVQTTDLIHPGEELNHLELSCSGTTIQAWINGVHAASVEDSTYRAGYMTIGGGSFSSAQVTMEARFDNVVITEP